LLLGQIEVVLLELLDFGRGGRLNNFEFGWWQLDVTLYELLADQVELALAEGLPVRYKSLLRG